MELAQQYLFDIGLYLPKISVLLFYWKTIPDCYPKLRIGLFCISGYVVICLLASVLVDTLICLPYDRNWYIISSLISCKWLICYQTGIRITKPILPGNHG